MRKWITACDCFACRVCKIARKNSKESKLVSLQIIDRNGFQETVSAKERLELYEKTNFLESQPYEKSSSSL